MPETESIVINTGPLLALIAAYGDLSLLERLYISTYLSRLKFAVKWRPVALLLSAPMNFTRRLFLKDKPAA